MTDRPREKDVGLAGLYDDPAALLSAARRVRDAGYRVWDCHTPYPLHGLDRAMGLRRSPIGLICLLAGLGGFLGAVALTGGLNAIQYPLNIGGKPLFSWQANVPIYFELFTLAAATTALVCVIVFCRLGRYHSALHDADIMKHVTADRFAIVLGADDALYDPAAARRLLEKTGCKDIRPLVEQVEE